MEAVLGFFALIAIIITLVGRRVQRSLAERRRIESVHQRYPDSRLRQLIIERNIWQGMTRD
jgi:hypothetical protein